MKRMLVVDDDDIDLEMIKRMFCGEYCVTATQCFRSALGQKFDVILVDKNMPDVSISPAELVGFARLNSNAVLRIWTGATEPESQATKGEEIDVRKQDASSIRDSVRRHSLAELASQLRSDLS